MFKACISSRLGISKKAFIMVFSYLLERYGTKFQNVTKLETISCFIAEKIMLDERSFCTGSLCGAYWLGDYVVCTQHSRGKTSPMKLWKHLALIDYHRYHHHHQHGSSNIQKWGNIIPHNINFNVTWFICCSKSLSWEKTAYLIQIHNGKFMVFSLILKKWC